MKRRVLSLILIASLYNTAFAAERQLGASPNACEQKSVSEIVEGLKKVLVIHKIVDTGTGNVPQVFVDPPVWHRMTLDEKGLLALNAICYVNNCQLSTQPMVNVHDGRNGKLLARWNKGLRIFD